MRVTVWFDKQLLRDGRGYQRGAQEFSKTLRSELRTAVTKALKEQNKLSLKKAKPVLERLQKKKLIRSLDPHRIVNGSTCTTQQKSLAELAKIPSVRHTFLRDTLQIPPPMRDIPLLEPPTQPNTKNLP